MVQLLDIGGVLSRTQIKKEEVISLEALNLADYLLNGALKIARPGNGHNAEVALVWASTHGLDGIDRDISFALQQVAPGFRDVGEAIARSLVIAGSHLSGCKVAQELRPRLFCVPDDNGVRVRLSLVGNERRVYSTNDHRHTHLSQLAREIVDTRSIRRNTGDADNIGIDCLNVQLLDPFIDDTDLSIQLLWHERSQGRQGKRCVSERFTEDSTFAVHWRLGHEKGDFHDFLPPVDAPCVQAGEETGVPFGEGPREQDEYAI